MSGRPAARHLAQLLGLPDAAEDADLKQAFRSTVKTLHPDVGGRAEDADRLAALTAAHRAYLDELGQSDAPGIEDDPWDDDWDVPDDGLSGDSSAAGGEENAPPDVAGRDRLTPEPWWTPPENGPGPRPGFWSQAP